MTTVIFNSAELGGRQLSYAYMTTLVIFTLTIIGVYRLYERYSKKSLIKKGIV